MSRAQAIHPNSVAAFQQEEEQLGHRAQAIYDYILAHGPRTDRELMQEMNFPDMNCVRPRVTELIDKAKLMEVCTRRCQVTGKTVRVVDIRGQRRLFQ